MKLVIGSVFIGGKVGSPQLQLTDGTKTALVFDLAELDDLERGQLAPYLSEITDIVVGFVDRGDLRFLRYFNNVTSIDVMTSKVRDVSGLRYLRGLKSLSIHRVKCRLDVLRDLKSLESIFLDSWPTSASSIFDLPNIRKASLRLYGEKNLVGASNWGSLQELWIHGGRLEDLEGIPVSIEKLRLTNVRHITSLAHIKNCSALQELLIDGCKMINTVVGLTGCSRLKVLSISGATIESLDPVRNLKMLEYVFLADGFNVVHLHGVDALYGLPALGKLIISRKLGVDPASVLRGAPGCNISVVR